VASSRQHPIELPQVIVWLLRLAADRTIAASMRYDAVAFAGWYAVMSATIEWPEEVKSIQTTQRDKKLSLDRMMKLLGQVNYAFAGRTTADHARRVLEGYAVHDWVQAHFSEFVDLASAARDRFQDIDKLRLAPTPFQSRLTELGDALQLSALERDILAFAFLNTASYELPGIFEQLAADRWAADHIWTAMFDTTNEALGRAMQPKSVLRVSGLLRATGRKTELASVSQFWVDLLAGASTLADAILEPMPAAAGSGVPARLGDEDAQLAGNILRNANEAGVNLLLYGASSLEKRHLVRELTKSAARKAWRVRKFEDAWRSDLPALALVAFNLLRGQPEPSVLVIDRPAEVLQTAPSEFIRSLFGIEMANDSIPDFDEFLLSHSPVPGIWLAGDIASLPDETVSRFVFQAPLKKADKAQRMASLLERLQGFKLSKKAVDEILKIEGVSTAQLEAAVKAARLSGAATKKERDQAVVQAVKRSQRALSRDVKAKAKESVTQYSLKYLNTAGRFGPERILEALRLNPQGSIVLYGPPGTGKTQFVEYLAQELGRPLVAKRASELFSKWLGESEKNISKAFEDAASEDAILLLDEGDSFLRDRSNAQASWEVTQVNELLQAMERFDGIVVVCTNLFSGLDAAALRRFTFKVEFRELTVDQRWEMFVNEAGLKGQLSTIPRGTRDDWLERLCFMQRLTAGDFATVKRQCTVLRTQLTPEEWLEQLKIECDVKSRSDGPKQVA
jgi:SpoVK/Ycf46/Vps4 family AAA+-type ATPase